MNEIGPDTFMGIPVKDLERLDELTKHRDLLNDTYGERHGNLGDDELLLFVINYFTKGISDILCRIEHGQPGYNYATEYARVSAHIHVQKQEIATDATPSISVSTQQLKPSNVKSIDTAL